MYASEFAFDSVEYPMRIWIFDINKKKNHLLLVTIVNHSCPLKKAQVKYKMKKSKVSSLA